MQLETGSTLNKPRVGLWANAYMTSKNYEYLGTLITKQSFDTVTQGQLPKLQARDVSKCKTTREEKCMK